MTVTRSRSAPSGAAGAVQEAAIHEEKERAADVQGDGLPNIPAAEAYAVASKTGLYLRASPAPDGEALTVLPFGCGVFLIDSAAGADKTWVHVRTGWLECWGMSDFLCPLTPQAAHDGNE